jgi:hypothetical protein
MLNVFDMDEVLIIKKGYDSITREYLDNNAPKRRTDKLLELMSLLKFLIQLLSNQQREPGKNSRPGGAAESEQLPPACIAFTFYPGGGLSSRHR